MAARSRFSTSTVIDSDTSSRGSPQKDPWPTPPPTRRLGTTSSTTPGSCRESSIRRSTCTSIATSALPQGQRTLPFRLLDKRPVKEMDRRCKDTAVRILFRQLGEDVDAGLSRRPASGEAILRGGPEGTITLSAIAPDAPTDPLPRHFFAHCTLGDPLSS
jgi:hypothetical protein